MENKSTGEAYDIIPGTTDGVATTMPDWPFPRGDVWFLRYRGSEIDDGVMATGPPYEAGLDAWLNGECLNGADVVVWYGAHFIHDIAHEEPGQFGHIVGPELRPVPVGFGSASARANWGARCRSTPRRLAAVRSFLARGTSTHFFMLSNNSYEKTS